jgi:diaminopimelate epimerase
MSSPFYKLQATGNDFIFFVADEGVSHLNSEKIRHLCSRHHGIGADGLVILKKEAGAEWTHRWDFYNADGGAAEMCGNAARCATHLLETRYSEKTIKVKTLAGVFSGTRAEDGQVEVIMNIPAGEPKELQNLFGGRFGGHFNAGYFTNTGVPHCVIPTENLWGLRALTMELVPFIFDAAFPATGSNLTFIHWLGEEPFETVTLERGVNDFTLSCGTGVIAAAKVYADIHGKGGWRNFKTPGGIISVFYQPGAQQVHLKGPAEYVYKGEI